MDLFEDIRFPIDQRLSVEATLQTAGLRLDPNIIKMSISFYTGLIHLYDGEECKASIIVAKGIGYCYYTKSGNFEE